MTNTIMITAKDVFEAMKDEYLKNGAYVISDTEFHKKVDEKRDLMIRLGHNYIDMRLSRTGLYTSRHLNPHPVSECPLSSTVNEFMNQFESTAQRWIDTPSLYATI